MTMDAKGNHNGDSLSSAGVAGARARTGAGAARTTTAAAGTGFGTGPSSGRPSFLPHQNISPSSPPASPPRYQRTHSNSLSRSLSENFNPESAEAKSIFLASSVLRSYPPAQFNTSRTQRSSHTASAAPPSPPESVLISQSVRQSRSTSAATVSAQLPVAFPALQPAVVIEPLSFRERLNKALPFRRVIKPQNDAEMSAMDPELERTPSLTLTTTHSPSHSLPTTGQNSAETAHPVYSNSFPVPLYADSKAPSIADSEDSRETFQLPTYYNESISYSKEPGSQRTSRRPSTFASQDPPPQIIVRGGEVKISIRRPSPGDDSEIFPSSLQKTSRDDGNNDSFSREGANGSALDDLNANTDMASVEEDDGDWFSENFPKHQMSARDSIPIQDSGLCIKGLQHRRAIKDLKHASQSPSFAIQKLPPSSPLQREPSTSDNSEEIYFSEALDYFRDDRTEEQDIRQGKHASSSIRPDGSDSNSSSQLSENSATGKLTLAKASSSILANSSLGSLHMRSNSSTSEWHRSETAVRNSSSSLDSPARSRNVGHDLDRILPTHTTHTTSAQTSPINLREAENVIASVSAELSKRLSGMSSSAGSQDSGSGSQKSDGFGAGLAIVVTADEKGELSDIRSKVIEAPVEDSRESENSSMEEAKRPRDKGKGKMQDSINGSGSSDSDRKRDMQGSDSSLSNNSREGERGKKVKVAIHPGDNRYDYVYRLRAASPDSQPMLIPHYRYPYPSGSFPDRNAFTVPKPVQAASISVLSPRKQSIPTLSEPVTEDNDSIKLSDAAYFNDSLTKASSFPSSCGRSGRSRKDLLGASGDGAAVAGPSSFNPQIGSSNSEGVSRTGAVAHAIASSAGLFSLGTGASANSNPYILPRPRPNDGSSPEKKARFGRYPRIEHRARSTPKPMSKPANTIGSRRNSLFNQSLQTRIKDPQGTAAYEMSSFRRLSDSGRRYFVSPSPHLYRVRTVERSVRADQADFESQRNIGPYPMTPEAIAQQKKWSWLLFAPCLLFFPFLLILGYGGMDSLVMSLTGGRVEAVGTFQKRLALWAGYIFGGVTIGVVVGVGIAVGVR